MKPKAQKVLQTLKNIRKYRKKLIPLVIGIIAILIPVAYLSLRNTQPAKAATLELTYTDTTIQIDVPKRYRIVIETGDADTLMTVYDRAENDANPNPTHEIGGPYILEASVSYALRDDPTRTTTVLENTPNRIKIRIKGKFGNEASTGYLEDETGTPEWIWVQEDYTFTNQGVFVNQTTFMGPTGITLDPDSGLQGYNWLGIVADITDAAFDDTASPTIYYGNGETESSASADFEFDDPFASYVVLPGNGSDTYQDAIVGVARDGWLDDTGVGAEVDEWHWDENQSGTKDLLYAQEQNHTVEDTLHSNWFFLLINEDALDTEVEREAFANNIRHPDIPTYTTGSQWVDHGPTPGLFLDSANDALNITDTATLSSLSAFTLETWVFNFDNTATGATGTHPLISKGDAAGNKEFRLRILGTSTKGDDSINCHFSTDGNDEQGGSVNLELTRHQAYHIACSWDGSNIKIYVNGQQLGPNLSASGTMFDAGVDLRLGSYSDGATAWAGLVMDEVRIWSDERTASEIQDNMHGQVDPTSSNLIGYWRMNENEGTTAYDLSGNNHNASFVSAPVWVQGSAVDNYNQGEGAYPITMSANQAEFDFDAGDNTSTLINDAGNVGVGDTTINADSTTGFSSSGVAFVSGDKFSYTSTTSTTFTGIPSTGELSVENHLDNSIVTMQNNYKPVVKLKNYRDNKKPTSALLEGNQLTEGVDYNVSAKPVSSAYFTQDLSYYLAFSGTNQTIEADVGTDATNSTAVVGEGSGKYGNGIGFTAANNDATFTSTGNIDYQAGAIQFYVRPSQGSVDSTERVYFSHGNDGSDQIQFRKSSSDDLEFYIHESSGSLNYIELVDTSNYDWSPNEQVHVRLEWDDTASAADQQKIFLNGVEPAHTDSSGDYDGTALSPDTTFRLGNDANTSGNFCNCVMDEFMIFDYNGSGDKAALEQTAEGGANINGNGYFGNEAKDYTFDFNAIDAQSRGEYIWVGSDSKFEGLNIDLETVGVGGSAPDFDWEYWNGERWTALSVTDQDTGASSFEAGGNFYWSEPSDWQLYGINNSPDLYYIRGHLVGGTYTTDPTENMIKTDILLFDLQKDISAENQTLTIPGWTSNSPPIAYYKFDEGVDNTCSGGTNDVCDSSGQSNDMALGVGSSSPSWQKEDFCISGKCLHFSGSSQYVSLADDPELDFDADDGFTITGWFRHPTISTSADEFITKHDGSGGYEITMSNEGEIYVNIDDDGTFDLADRLESPLTYDDSKWHHVAYSKDGTTGVYLYMDGLLVDSDTSLAESGSLENADPLYLGVDDDGGGLGWDGFIDEVKVYRYARSAAEILTDFNTLAENRGAAASFGGDNSYLSNGLIGYWPMEVAGSGTGLIVEDISGNNRDGTTEGTPDCSVAGKFGLGCDFTGDTETDEIDMGDFDIDDTDLTFAAWINVDDYSADEGNIFAKQSSVGDEPVFNVMTDGSLLFAVRAGTNSKQTAASIISTNTWHHVAVVYTDNDTTGDATIYLDGKPQANSQQDDALPDIFASGDNFTIGRRDSGNDELDGTVDDARLYNRAFSSNEVRKLYNWAPGPVVHYPFDEGSGTSTVYDHSGNSYNGSMNGSMTEDDWVIGKYGSALDFDGSDDYLNLTTIGPRDYDEFSFSVWYKSPDSTVGPPAGSNDEYIYMHDESSGTDKIILAITDDTSFVGFPRLTIDIDTQDLYYGATNVVDETWHHIAVVRTSTQIIFYIDGVLDSATNDNDAGESIQIQSGGSPVGPYIGWRDPSEQLHGQLDDFKFYNYARTPAQIIQDMNAGHPAPGSPVGSPIGYWSFDEGYGDTANDSSPQALNGTLGDTITCPSAAPPLSCPTWTTAGKIGYALDFSGSNNTVDLDESAAYDIYRITGDVTISAWINADTVGDAEYILHSGETGSETEADNDNYFLRWDTTSGNDLEYGHEYGTGTDDFNVFDVNLNTGQWYHVAIVRDVTTNTVDLYVGGAKGTTFNYTSDPTGGSDGEMAVGSNDDKNGNFFDGRIDEVKIYNSALTADQIKIEFSGGAAVLGDLTTDAEVAEQADGAPTNLVLHYNFDEYTGTGAVVNDTSGNENQGTMDAGMTESDWVKGKYGGALYFDGTPDDEVFRANTDSLDLGSDGAEFTFTAWVKRTGACQSADSKIIELNETGGGATNIRLQCDDATNAPEFQVRDEGGSFAEADSTTALTLNQWHHLAGVWDSSDTATLYVDGMFIASGTEPQTSNYNDGILRIGGSSSDGGRFFEGLIDEVKIYASALTAGQIAYEFNRGKPIGHWQFDECQGTTAYDASGFENNGNIGIGATAPNTSAGTCSSGNSAEAWNNGTTGKRNASLDFDGIDDYVDLGAPSELDFSGSGSFTLSAWARSAVATIGTSEYIVTKNNSATDNRSIRLFKNSSTQGLSFTIDDDGTSGNECDTNENLPKLEDTNWHHVIGIFDNVGNTITTYVDGIQDVSVACATNPFDASANWIIGDMADFTRPFNGQIDDVQIFNYALSTNQVKKLYNNGAVGFGQN